MRSRMKRVGRLLAAPLAVYFDKRFAGVHGHLETDAARREEIATGASDRLAAIEQRLERLEARLTSELVPLEELLVVLQQELHQARRDIERADARTA